MDSSGDVDRPLVLRASGMDYYSSSSYTEKTGAEYCPRFSSMYHSGVNWKGDTSTAYPGASVPGPSSHTPSYPKYYEEGSSLHFCQRSTYDILPQLPYEYASQEPTTVGDEVYWDSGGNQDAFAYPPSPPVEQWDEQAAPGQMFFSENYMLSPCVSPSSLKNTGAVISASPESSMICSNDICDTGRNHDMDTYPVDSMQWDSQADPGSILSNAGDEKPTGVAPSLFEDKAASITSTMVSTPKGPTTNTDYYCPICPAPLGRPQDRKRHITSHLPRWLQCQVPGCPWRGDRLEHLKKHRRKVHPSCGQELDTLGSIIYDPWPLVKRITDDATFEIAYAIAISLVQEKAEELKKSKLWRDLYGRRRRRTLKVYCGSARVTKFPRGSK